TNQRYSTSSLRASLILKFSPCVHFARARADCPNELPCLPKFSSAFCKLPSSVSPSLINRWRISTMSTIGALPTGHTSTHAPHVVHAHTASLEMAKSNSDGDGLPFANAKRFSLSQ